jgi:hypothetical protein
MLAFASHHSPFAQSARLTAGIAIVTAAIDPNAAAAADTARVINVFISCLPQSAYASIEPSRSIEVKAEAGTPPARLA